MVAIGDPETHSEPVFNTIVDTNLKGVWHTMLATVPSIVRKGRGGSVVLISSSQGLTGQGGDGSAAMFAYAASKHGVVGLMRSAANAYAPHKIRVNSVHPSGVATPMILNDFVVNRMLENPNPAVSQMLLPGVPLVEPQDVTEAVLWLVGPGSRYVTGVAYPSTPATWSCKSHVMCSPRLRTQSEGSEAAPNQTPNGDGQVHEAFCIPAEYRPDQGGQLRPQHAMLYPVHRVGDVVERIGQRQSSGSKLWCGGDRHRRRQRRISGSTLTGCSTENKVTDAQARR